MLQLYLVTLIQGLIEYEGKSAAPLWTFLLVDTDAVDIVEANDNCWKTAELHTKYSIQI
jgi:hypothetical protein